MRTGLCLFVFVGSVGCGAFVFFLIVVVGVFAKYYFSRVVFWGGFLVWVGFWVFVRSGKVGLFNNLLGVCVQRWEGGRGCIYIVHIQTYVQSAPGTRQSYRTS